MSDGKDLEKVDTKTDEEGQVADPKEISQILQNAPPQTRRVFEMGFSHFQGNPLLQKLNDQHIDKAIEYTHIENKHLIETERSNRNYKLGYVVLGVGVFVFLVAFLLPNDKDLLIEIIKLLAVFIGGFGGGVAYSKKQH